MKHLTIEEIMSFVSMNTLSADTISLSKTVNSHIRDCGECLKKVRAFREVHDEFARLGTVDHAARLVYREAEADTGEQEPLIRRR